MLIKIKDTIININNIVYATIPLDYLEIGLSTGTTLYIKSKERIGKDRVKEYQQWLDLILEAQGKNEHSSFLFMVVFFVRVTYEKRLDCIQSMCYNITIVKENRKEKDNAVM